MDSLPDIEKEFGNLRSLIGKCRDLKIEGYWQGSEYCYHPCGVIRGGIKLVDHWNVNDYRGISISENPEALWTKPYNDSLGSGQANPKPQDCEEIRVWFCGKWEKDGPWVQKIYSMLKDLKSEIDSAQIIKDQQSVAEKEMANKIKSENEAKLKSAWEKD